MTTVQRGPVVRFAQDKKQEWQGSESATKNVREGGTVIHAVEPSLLLLISEQVAHLHMLSSVEQGCSSMELLGPP